jgi:hypothetical protein
VSGADETRRSLNVIGVVAALDALLLVPLVIAALSHAEGTVDVLGPLHGTGFLLLVGLIVRGKLRGLWGWWFPVLAVVTAGPPGCLIADLRIRRSLAHAPA